MNRVIYHLTTDSEHQWGTGCPSCAYGIVSAPELTGACSLYLERIVLMTAGDIQFCECQAGTRYHAALLNRRQILIEEARKDPRMAEQAARLSHVEIDIARHLLGNGRGVPTVRWESEQVPTP